MSSSVILCECGVKVRLPENQESRSFRCPQCKKGMAITAESMVLKSVALSAGKEATCPICQTEMQAGESSVTCPSCDQVHHQECWSEVGGCGTYGCKQAPKIDKSEATSAAPLTAWGDTKKCPACGETIKAIAMRCRYCSTEFQSVDPMSVTDLRKQAKSTAELESFQSWVIALFVLSLLGCLAPLVLIVASAYLLPKQVRLKQCGPVFIIMGWTSIALSGLYTVLLLFFLLFQDF